VRFGVTSPKLVALGSRRQAEAGNFQKCDSGTERFLQIQMIFVVECLREDFEDAPQYPGAHPVLKSPVAGLIGRVSVRRVRPRSPGPQDPEDPVEYGTVLFPRALSTVCAARQLGQEGPDESSLLIREGTGMRRSKKDHPATMARGAIQLLAPTSVQ
jgi:hypothetical protein